MKVGSTFLAFQNLYREPHGFRDLCAGAELAHLFYCVPQDALPLSPIGYRDQGCIAALESFLSEAVRGSA